MAHRERMETLPMMITGRTTSESYIFNTETTLPDEVARGPDDAYQSPGAAERDFAS